MKTNTEQQAFECWAMVELFGHQKIAGKVSEQSIAGSAMLRIDVPETDGHGAIYSINPTSEQIARGMVSRCGGEPVRRYELPQMIDAPAETDDDVDEEGGADEEL